MICFRDKTFCPFYRNCIDADKCGRALTAGVFRAAKKWWNDDTTEAKAPISRYVNKPKCFKKNPFIMKRKR